MKARTGNDSFRSGLSAFRAATLRRLASAAALAAPLDRAVAGRRRRGSGARREILENSAAQRRHEGCFVTVMNRIVAIITLGMFALTACASSTPAEEEVDEGALTKKSSPSEATIDQYELVEAAIDANALAEGSMTVDKQMAAANKPGFVGTRFKNHDFGVTCEDPSAQMCKLVAIVKLPALEKKQGKVTTKVAGPLAETLADVFAPTSARAKVRTEGVIDCRRSVGREEGVVCEVNLQRHTARSTTLVNLVANGGLPAADAEAMVKKFQ